MTPTIQQILGQVELFRGIKAGGLEIIASTCTQESHAPGTVLFREGEPGTGLYIIVEGKVRISKNIPSIGEEALAVLGPGQSFGEMAMVDDHPRSADAYVHERVRLLVLSKAAVEELLLMHQHLAYEILWNFSKILARRLRETNDKMTFLSISGKF